MHLSINIGLEGKMSISTTLLWPDISRKVNFLASNNIAIRKQDVQSLIELPDTFPLILLNKTPWVLFAIIKSNNWKEKKHTGIHKDSYIMPVSCNCDQYWGRHWMSPVNQQEPAGTCQQLQLVNICSKYLSGPSGFFFPTEKPQNNRNPSSTWHSFSSNPPIFISTQVDQHALTRCFSEKGPLWNNAVVPFPRFEQLAPMLQYLKNS